ncbi:MAG: caspase family protein [Bacteroidetes bacterium]|nr:caspase family protein [Bacteroidota bacterium]
MKNFESITRKAILIGCPGGNDNFLSGVRKDLENMSRFLQSNKGGAWTRNEIIVLQNPNSFEALNLVNQTTADYIFVYFSGHGFSSLNNSRMLMLRDQAIADCDLLNDSPRQLVIIDACRNYSAPGLSGVPEFDEHVDHFESAAYEVFSEGIACSPEGKLIVHATQPGRYSYDSPSGGYFTQALLHVATRMKTEEHYSPCTVNSVLYHVPNVLKRNRNNQIPNITYRSGDLTVPFALGSVSALGGTKKEVGGELVGAAILTVLLIGVIVAASSN